MNGLISNESYKVLTEFKSDMNIRRAEWSTISFGTA